MIRHHKDNRVIIHITFFQLIQIRPCDRQTCLKIIFIGALLFRNFFHILIIDKRYMSSIYMNKPKTFLCGKVNFLMKNSIIKLNIRRCKQGFSFWSNLQRTKRIRVYKGESFQIIWRIFKTCHQNLPSCKRPLILYAPFVGKDIVESSHAGII